MSAAGSRSAVARGRRAVTGALLLLALAAPVASAHGGYPVLEERDGAYGVLVQAARSGADAIDLTTYVTRQDLGEPDLGATVTLRITDDGETRTVRPTVVGDGYEAIVPGAPNAWRHWRIEATVQGDAGRTVVAADPAQDYDGVPGWLWPVLAVAVLAAAVASILILRRRTAGDAA